MFFAILFVGFSIKLTDDFLDHKDDLLVGKITWAQRLGDSLVPYTLFCLMLACYFHLGIGISYFLAAYGIGMVKDHDTKYLSGLVGWQEVILALGLSFLMVGGQQTLIACGIMWAVQLIDDLSDYRKEPTARNFVNRLGRLEVWYVLIITLVCVGTLSLAQTVGSAFAMYIIELLTGKVAVERVDE